MILLPLGLLLLMLFSLRWSSSAASALLSSLAARFAPKGAETGPLVMREAMAALATSSPKSHRLQALLAQALRLGTWRSNFMRLCFAELGLWFPLVAASCFLQINGLFLAVVPAWMFLVLALVGRPRCLRDVSAVLFCLALFLIFGESLLRFSAGWMTTETTDLSMLLADNRPAAVAILALAMTVLSAVGGVEFLAIVLALGGLAGGVLSLNGAVALLWGERLGLALRLQWQARRQIPSVKKLAKILTLSTIAALPFAFLILGVARDQIGLMGGRDSLPSLFAGFVDLSVLTALPFLIVVSAVGHFAAKATPDDLMERASVPQAWWREAGLGDFQIQALRAGLRERQAEIERLREGFNEEEWKKVPPPVREASQRELAHLQEAQRDFEAHLSSRWSFFGHQRD